MYTTHGDHIPGTRLGSHPSLEPSRCGGVSKCPECMQEAASVSDNREEYYDIHILLRVFNSLREAGVSPELAQKAIFVMQVHEIIFRERKNL